MFLSVLAGAVDVKREEVTSVVRVANYLEYVQMVKFVRKSPIKTSKDKIGNFLVVLIWAWNNFCIEKFLRLARRRNANKQPNSQPGFKVFDISPGRTARNLFCNSPTCRSSTTSLPSDRLLSQKNERLP